MNGTYAPGEPHQEITLTIRFNVKHNPGTPFHLKTLLQTNDRYIRGKDIFEEDGKLIYEV